MKPFMLITIEEFKESILFDTNFEESTTYNDNYITEAIYISSTNADFFTGFKLSKLLEQNPNYDIGNIKFGIIRQVQHLLRKGIEYMRGQASFTIGSQSYSTNNPDDPYYIVPELLIELQKANLLEKQFISNVLSHKQTFNYINDNTYDGQTKYVNWRDANAKFVKYEKVKSSDNTILFITPDNPYDPILDLIVNKQPLIDLIIPSLLQDPNLIKVLIEALKINPELIENVKNKIISDEQFLNIIKQTASDYTKEQLLQDKEWLNKVAQNVPPITQEKFDELISNSQIFNDKWIEMFNSYEYDLD